MGSFEGLVPRPIPDVPFWRFSVPNTAHGEGWAIAFLDNFGVFSVMSDYGDYAHRWSPPKGADFRKEFLTTTSDQILFKIAPRVFDAEATSKRIREHIEECQAAGNHEHDDELDELDFDDDEQGFIDWARNTTIEDVSDFRVQKFDQQAVAFIDQVLPRLREVIKADLEANPLPPKEPTP